MCDGHFEIAVVQDGEATRVVLVGEIDLAAAAQLRTALSQALSSGRVIIDLSLTTFVDSTAISAFVVAERAAREIYATLTVKPGPASVMRTLQLAGVHELLRVEDYEATSNQTTLPTPGTGSAPQSLDND